MSNIAIILKDAQYTLPLPDEMSFTSKGITFKVPTDEIVEAGWSAMLMGHWHEHFTNGVKSDTDDKDPMPGGGERHMEYITSKIDAVCGIGDIKASAIRVPPVVGETRRIIKNHMLNKMGFKHKDLPLDGVWGRTLDSVREAALGFGLTDPQVDIAQERAEAIVAQASEGL